MPIGVVPRGARVQKQHPCKVKGIVFFFFLPSAQRGRKKKNLNKFTRFSLDHLLR